MKLETHIAHMIQIITPFTVTLLPVEVEDSIHTFLIQILQSLQSSQVVEVAPVEEDQVVVVNKLQLPLIGLPKVKFPQSKTKVNAVPAGLSPPLEISLPEELSTTTPIQLITPSNNSLIALDLSETMDAVEVSWTPLSNMLNNHHLRPQLTTHTKLLQEAAFILHPKEQDLSLVSPTSNTTVFQPSRLLL